MNVDTDSLVPFIIMWGIPTFMVVRAYLKMNPDDQKSAINDFKSSRFIFTIGFIVIGAFLAHLGFLFSVSIIEMLELFSLPWAESFRHLIRGRKAKPRVCLFLF